MVFYEQRSEIGGRKSEVRKLKSKNYAEYIRQGIVLEDRDISVMTKVYSKRLLFRKPNIEDADILFTSYTRDAEVAKFTTWEPHTSVGETKSFIKACIDKWNKKQ